MRLEAFLRDVRYALRGLRRTPGFAAIAIATLGLAIGANAAIFSVVDALLIRPLPYRNDDRLVAIDMQRQVEGATRSRPNYLSIAATQRLRESLHVFGDVVFYDTNSFELTTRNGPELIDGATVSPNFFSALDGAIIAGQAITTANAQTPSILISQRLAERVFGGLRQAIDQPLTLNSQTYTIIGVAGPNWDIPSPTTDVWRSIAFARTIDARCCNGNLLARLEPDKSVAAARDDVQDAIRRLSTVDAENFGRLTTTVSTVRSKQLGAGRTALLLLWAAVGVVLVIACANLLNLLVARNVSRQREMAIRQALGAPRGRLVVQGLTESAVLASAGVFGGLLVANLATATLARVDPAVFPQLHNVHVDVRVLGFAIGLGLLTIVATGIAPAIQAATGAARHTRNATPTRQHRRLQQMLCVAQLAAAVVLLVSATLLGRSLVDLLGTDLGVSPDHVMTASINAAFGRPHTAPELASMLQRVVDRVAVIPGVDSVGASTSLPPSQSRMMMSIIPPGSTVEFFASAVSCSPGYFHALGLRLVKGRFFTTDDDAQHSAVIILGQSTARHLFGDRDPIGQTLGVPRFPYGLTTSKSATVVGVVSDVKYGGIDAKAGDQIYWSLQQVPWLSTFLTIRMANDQNLVPALRASVATVDPTIAITSIKPLETILATATAPARFRTVLIAAFALIALTIAAIGLYGIVAYSVSQRTAEIGVRVALGAVPRNVISMVLAEALGVTIVGLAIGLPLAYMMARTFAALLFGVAPADAATYVASAVALLCIAIAAALVPARRAARVDPIVALRAE
jgi:putative ABC transport system permease protein